MESLQATPLPLELSDRLSPELYDRFIDHLHSFKHSLSACSTVCQSWFPSSRYHLFFDVNLSPDLVHFLHSSSHAMETITPYIHDVALGGAWISELRSKFDVVISLLLKLKSCRELYLETWSWDFLSDTSKNLLLRSERSFFKDITVIHLKYIRFPSFSLLIEFIGRFPTLQDLSFDNVTWNPEDSQISREAQAYFPRPLRLTKLYIRSCLVEPILSWLFGDDEQILQTPPIHVLALPEILSGELNVVGRVLRALGSSLQHVELGFLSPNLRDSPNHGKVIWSMFITGVVFNPYISSPFHSRGSFFQYQFAPNPCSSTHPLPFPPQNAFILFPRHFGPEPPETPFAIFLAHSNAHWDHFFPP